MFEMFDGCSDNIVQTATLTDDDRTYFSKAGSYLAEPVYITFHIFQHGDHFCVVAIFLQFHFHDVYPAAQRGKRRSKLVSSFFGQSHPDYVALAFFDDDNSINSQKQENHDQPHVDVGHHFQLRESVRIAKINPTIDFGIIPIELERDHAALCFHFFHHGSQNFLLPFIQIFKFFLLNVDVFPTEGSFETIG